MADSDRRGGFETERSTADRYGISMDAGEVGRFLTRRGSGVLSFAKDDEPYAIPVSFGFDPIRRRFVIQLLFDRDSSKRDFVTDGSTVSLVTYEWNDPYDWRSVVARGTLEPIPEDEVVSAAETFAHGAQTVSLAVFDEPIENLEAEWYQIEVAELSGRTAPVDGDAADRDRE